MKGSLAAAIAVSVLIVAYPPALFAGETACAKGDAVCRDIAALSKAGRFGQIIEKVRPKQSYSREARELIGQAYLMEAGREGIPQQQEEEFCLKAVEYGAVSGYLGLYFMHAGTDRAKANGYLKQLIATKPEYAAPYVLLGEADYEQGSFRTAKDYLQEGRKMARGRSGDLDWLLFKTSYLSGDYTLASSMLDSSFSQGKTVGDLKALVASDPRFSEMGKQYEFRKFFKILNGNTLAKLSMRT